MTAAMSIIVVLPNHIRKFMKPMSDLVPNTLPIKSIGLLITPIDCRIEFTGPLFENSVKNKSANACLLYTSDAADD